MLEYVDSLCNFINSLLHMLKHKCLSQRAGLFEMFTQGFLC